MLWHHLIVDGEVVRSIYEPFGEDARPLMVEAIRAFPELAYEIANCTLIGTSDPYANRTGRICSVYKPNAPEWHSGPADHHCMKLNLDTGDIEWKIVWTPPFKKPILDVPGTCKWIGMNYDSALEETGEYHEYYEDVNPSNPRDLIGYTCNKDGEILHEKLYVHPHWFTQGEYFVSNWDHLKNMNLPTDVIPAKFMELTKGLQWIN